MLKMHESNNDDGLVVQRIAGGSIVNKLPVFSPDGELIFAIYRNIVHTYSTVTGEWVRDLEGAKDDIVNIQYESHGSKLLTACTQSGQVVKWKWKTGGLEGTCKIPTQGRTINSYHVINTVSDTLSAFVTLVNDKSLHMAVVDLASGKANQSDLVIDIDTNHKIDVDIEKNHFNYAAVINGHMLHVINYHDWSVKKWFNIKKENLSCVRCHPTEQMIATGDVRGRILLWREIFKGKQPCTTLYHWHHTPVASVAFTESGTNFYSGGQEAVLVKWNLERPDLKTFLPRLSGSILHITVSQQNKKVAMSMDDNAIQILGPQNQTLCVLQNFTFIGDRKTGLDRFPIGLQSNPRTNTLVLNGRSGHIQFYSTYTRSLLYNLDVVLQNRLSTEVGKILYDIRVTNAAFNINWMATCEEWDDQEHSPENRLKFWEFSHENQNYSLNTNIENVHMGGIRAVSFSNNLEAENLLLATAGRDNVIKLWSLENSTSIYKKGKVWYCIAKTSYKNLPVYSIDFSQDGSLLAAGFGNSLCLYKADTLKLKVTLTAPGGIDGTLAKTTILLPKNVSSKSPKKKNIEEMEKTKNIMKMFESYLDGTSSEIVKKLKSEYSTIGHSEEEPKFRPVSSIKLNNSQKELVFKKIMSLHDLNFFQKIDLFQKLEIYCTLNSSAKERIRAYVTKNILDVRKQEKDLRECVKNMSCRDKFKAKYLLEKYLSRKHNWNMWSNKKLVPISEILSFGIEPIAKRTRQRTVSNKASDDKKQNGFSENKKGECSDNDDTNHQGRKDIVPEPPVHDVAAIKFIVFGLKEHAHLVIVCTKHRVLIWNLLTLRLQSVLKLSTEQITVDPMTGLVAIFTVYNELYVFMPNAPIPLYHRTELSPIHGATWVPRRIPKPHSLNIDWQAMSILYFLTDKQEICCLLSESDKDPLIASATFANELQDPRYYSVFGRYSRSQLNASQTDKSNQMSIGVPGKASVKSLIETATHTMASVNLLSKNFIKSLLLTEDHSQESSDEDDEDNKNERDDEDEMSDDEVKTKIEDRKSRMELSENRIETKPNEEKISYKNILKETIQFDYKVV